MAATFGADPGEAERVAGQLRVIRSGLADPGSLYSGAEATGSRRVQAALERFRDDSSDSREHMIELLDRAAGMLTALAEGAGAVDAALAASFDEAGGTGQTDGTSEAGAPAERTAAP